MNDLSALSDEELMANIRAALEQIEANQRRAAEAATSAEIDAYGRVSQRRAVRA